MVGMVGDGKIVAEYVPVSSKQFPKSRNPLSAESKFWRTFKRKVSEQQTFAVTCINFCPTPPHDFAVTSSTRVVIYDGTTCEVKKTISRFTDLAYSGSFRSDGQLLVAGGETGIIQVFDVNSRTVLRQLKGHTRAVHWVRYSPLDKLHVLSASDDSTARWWDVASQEVALKLEGHTDYVRCGASNPSSADIWATGSYDHTARIWDLRSAQSVLTLEHGKPLEDVLFFPSGGLVATAGGNVVKIWDVMGGGKLLHQLGSHQKTVTSLCMTKSTKSSSASVEESPRLLTSSLDGHMRVFELNSYKVTHVAKYPAPILDMDVSFSCTTLAVGTATGLLSVRQKKDRNQEDSRSSLVSEDTKLAPSRKKTTF
ncbi:hypothetical protein O6H91_03G079500 [Diphasiastrum complanatum]|uniref:Uncharacterized protein n=1 Tax=Diphasiastrum complanatum TaxID=34168 RepID=A0ACC2E832_DIPCM|nr:hypothetical protein O6H91_03G079500 [Diphasiastrum complanatum]